MTHNPLLTTHTISLLVTNKPGVLLRIILGFSRRGFNIESLVVSSAFDGSFSRMSITAKGDPATLEQIIKQSNKIIDVIHVEEHQATNSIDAELALIKIKNSKSNQDKILQIMDHYKAKSLDLTASTFIIQVSGSTEKINACIDMLNPFKILEIVRTGKLVMARGEEVT